MADTTSTTPPPPGQAQPAAASFDTAAWNQNDASFLKPSIPLPKAQRAWERAPHSPFARNGKYRKVWKRHETRSKTKAAITQENGQKSPAKSPKKVVKKRALESKMEANATPGRTRPKNKAFAATRFERLMSGLLPRKLVQARAVPDEPTKKPTTEEPTEPEPAEAEEQHTESAHNVEDDQLSTPPSSPTRQIMDEIARSPVKRAPPAPVQSIEETADATMSGGEREPSASREDPNLAEEQVSSGVEFEDEQMEDEETESAEEEPEALVYESIEADIVQTRDDQHFSQPHTGERQYNVGEGASTNGEVHSSSAKEITETQDDTKQDTLETVESEPTEPSDSKDRSAPSTQIDTVMSDHEETPVVESVESTESTVKESVEVETAAENWELSLETSEKSESKGAEVTTSLEDEESDLTSLSDEEMEDAEQFEEALAPEEFPDALADTEPRNLPSPSLSDATSPKFSAVADTLTLSMPEAATSPSKTTEEKKEPTSPIDSDTAFLRDFLSRADASKASKAANIARRESLTNRRDSDVVRQALASPRVALEDRDPNSPRGESPRRGRSKDAEESASTKTPLSRKLDFNAEITADLTLEPQTPATEKAETAEEPQNTRRSARARKTRIPSTPVPSAIPAPNRIPVRRADGTEPVVLKKTEAQELATLTRANTRRNKGGALAAPIRLNKLKAEILKASKSNEDFSSAMDPAPGADIWPASKLRWDQQLVYFQEEENKNPLLSEDELALKAGEDTRKSKATPSRVKRAKGLGTSNGTPGKGLLAPASLLPPEVQAEKEATATAAKPSSKKSVSSSKKSIPKPSTTAITSSETAAKASVPTDAQAQSKEAAAVPEPAKAPQASQLLTPSASKKSRLATPKKVKLPVPVGTTSTTPVPVQNMPPASMKETRLARPAAPKKLAAPKAGGAATGAVAESGRRRIGRRA